MSAVRYCHHMDIPLASLQQENVLLVVEDGKLTAKIYDLQRVDHYLAAAL